MLTVVTYFKLALSVSIKRNKQSKIILYFRTKYHSVISPTIYYEIRDTNPFPCVSLLVFSLVTVFMVQVISISLFQYPVYKFHYIYQKFYLYISISSYIFNYKKFQIFRFKLQCFFTNIYITSIVSR